LSTCTVARNIYEQYNTICMLEVVLVKNQARKEGSELIVRVRVWRMKLLTLTFTSTPIVILLDSELLTKGNPSIYTNSTRSIDLLPCGEKRVLYLRAVCGITVQYVLHQYLGTLAVRHTI